MDSDEREPLFTAADIKEFTGLSYRQLNEWDRRGALPDSRDAEANWRKFSLKTMFVILVCAELRGRFGIPLESLKWLQKVMLQPKANHFLAAFGLMRHGINVLLLTDFRETFRMVSDDDIGDLVAKGYMRDERPGAFVLLRVNPLVNRLLGFVEESKQLKVTDDIDRAVRAAVREWRVRTPEELEVLRLLRNGGYTKVAIRLSNGQIVRTDAETEYGTVTADELVKLVQGADFQTVSVTTQNGKIVRVCRNRPNITGRKRGRQDTPEPRRPGKKG